LRLKRRYHKQDLSPLGVLTGVSHGHHRDAAGQQSGATYRPTPGRAAADIRSRAACYSTPSRTRTLVSARLGHRIGGSARRRSDWRCCRLFQNGAASKDGHGPGSDGCSDRRRSNQNQDARSCSHGARSDDNGDRSDHNRDADNSSTHVNASNSYDAGRQR